MPFVDQEHRVSPDIQIAGDRCYLYYVKMVQRWKEAPRWTTVDSIYKDLVEDTDDTPAFKRARELAWLVFFNLYAMPYELIKRSQNGDI